MDSEKSKNEGAKVFLGIVTLLGGVICILVPASTLQDRSLFYYTLMGISLVVFGSMSIWEAIESFKEIKRERRRQENKKDTKVQ